jgi:hypothetical protein
MIVFVITLAGLNVKMMGLFRLFFQIAAVYFLLSGLQSILLWVLSMALITFLHSLVLFGLSNSFNLTIIVG